MPHPLSWLQDEKMIADILTKDKPDKIGLTDMMQQEQLKVVKQNDNIVFHNGRDYKMVGRALRDKLIKINVMLPKMKKVKQAQEDLVKKIKQEEEEGESKVKE